MSGAEQVMFQQVRFRQVKIRIRLGVANILVLIVGGIPVAMPTLLSITLAIGLRMALLKSVLNTSFEIVRQLQSLNKVVGMTGDGVSDALLWHKPSLVLLSMMPRMLVVLLLILC